MVMARVLGILILLAGLVLVGISGDNHRAPNGRNIAGGATLMVVGALIALFARQASTLMGWGQP